MNVVKVMGGLGNQLFQYAFGRVVEEYSKCSTGYDLSWYSVPRVPPRPYVLDKFDIIVSKTLYLNTRKENERFDCTPSLYTDNTYFSGYWQNADLYNFKLIEEFRQRFHVKEEYHTPEFIEWRDKIRSCKAVAIHVRRGDYLIHPNHLVLPLQYYQNALMYLDAMRKEIEVFIFSDDLDWCADHFEDCYFVELPEDYLEFELMRECKHFIIANSTFSWWAAYLSLNGIVIAPKKWWRNSVNGHAVYEKRMLREDWMHINLS